MKKRIVIYGILAVMLLSGCSSKSKTSSSKPIETQAPSSVVVKDNRNTTDDTSSKRQYETVSESEAPSVAVTDSDFECKGYLYENSIGSTQYFLIVKNNSNNTVSITANGTAYDSNGKALGADSADIDVLGPNETTLTYFFFDNVKGVDNVEYTLSYNSSPHYKPVIAALDVKQSLNEKNVIIEVTNNSNYSAQFVEAHALFFDANNKVIGHSSEYITDSGYEIKPGATLSGQLDLYSKSYDHVEVYFTGRADGISFDKDKAQVTDADFDIKDYLYTNEFSSKYYLIFTNKSSETVAISANATAKDASGNVVGAADMEISVLGPGETSIGSFFFMDVKNIAKIDYQTTYDTVSYYKPVLNNIQTDVTINESNVIIKATNNGNIAAQFLEAEALFFDANNNIISADSTYITDGDYELKPGATLTEQITTYKSFDHVEVYYTARG